MWFFSASIVDYSDYFEDFELRNGHIPKHVTISRRAYVEGSRKVPGESRIR